MYLFLRLTLGLYCTYCSYKYTKIALNAFLDGILAGCNKNSLSPSDSEFSDSDSKLLDTDLKNLDSTHIPPGGADKAVELVKKPGPVAKAIQDRCDALGKLIGGLLLKNKRLLALVEKLDKIFRRIAIILEIGVTYMSLKVFGLLEQAFWLEFLTKVIPDRFSIKHFLNALKRMILGYRTANCQADTTKLIDQLADPNIAEVHKYGKLKQVFKYYENLGEHHFLKNPYFYCLMQIFVSLLMLDERGPFMRAVKYLTKLFANKIISKQTYYEFVSYLINQGANPLDFPDVNPE